MPLPLFHISPSSFSLTDWQLDPLPRVLSVPRSSSYWPFRFYYMNHSNIFSYSVYISHSKYVSKTMTTSEVILSKGYIQSPSFSRVTVTKDEHLLEMLLGVEKSERSLTMWLCVCTMLGRVLSLPPRALNATIPTVLDDKTLECNTSFRKRNVSQ